jgi:hypothetical protein
MCQESWRGLAQFSGISGFKRTVSALFSLCRSLGTQPPPRSCSSVSAVWLPFSFRSFQELFASEAIPVAQIVPGESLRNNDTGRENDRGQTQALDQRHYSRIGKGMPVSRNLANRWETTGLLK